MARQWLERKLVIYVPSTYKNRPISEAEHRQRVNEVVAFFTKKYGGTVRVQKEPLTGGTTQVRAVGTWEEGGKTIKERVTKVEVFLDAPVWEKHKGEIYRWGERKQAEWGQTSVAFEKDVKLTFLEKKDNAPPPKARRRRGLAAKLLKGY